MTSGKINVSVENIFPLIKKFLYSDHEIFLRELISNGTDATLKLKHLTSIGEANTEYGNPIIEIKIDKEGKKLHIIDQGIGMTSDEVEKYIKKNQCQVSKPIKIYFFSHRPYKYLKMNILDN
jgi:molecular chaperone HtpG